MSDEKVASLPQGLTLQKTTFRHISELVDSTKWGDNLSGKEVEALSKYLQLCAADKGMTIVREGSREAYLCLVVDGRVNVMKEGRQIGSVGPGHTFGEMSLIDGEPRSASVVAEEKTTLIVLTRDGFANLSLEVPALAIKVLFKIAKLLSQRLRQTSGALVEQLGD